MKRRSTRSTVAVTLAAAALLVAGGTALGIQLAGGNPSDQSRQAVVPVAPVAETAQAPVQEPTASLSPSPSPTASPSTSAPARPASASSSSESDRAKREADRAEREADRAEDAADHAEKSTTPSAPSPSPASPVPTANPEPATPQPSGCTHGGRAYSDGSTRLGHSTEEQWSRYVCDDGTWKPAPNAFDRTVPPTCDGQPIGAERDHQYTDHGSRWISHQVCKQTNTAYQDRPATADWAQKSRTWNGCEPGYVARYGGTQTGNYCVRG